jgi:hypothetical protein
MKNTNIVLLLSFFSTYCFAQEAPLSNEMKFENLSKRSEGIKYEPWIHGNLSIPCPNFTICDKVIQKYTGLTTQQYCNKFQSDYFSFVFKNDIQQMSVAAVDMNLANVLYNKKFPMILINGRPLYGSTYYFNESGTNPFFRTEIIKVEKLKDHPFKNFAYQDGELIELESCDFDVINIEL